MIIIYSIQLSYIHSLNTADSKIYFHSCHILGKCMQFIALDYIYQNNWQLHANATAHARAFLRTNHSVPYCILKHF